MCIRKGTRSFLFAAKLLFIFIQLIEFIAAYSSGRFKRADECDSNSECKLLPDCPIIANYFNEKFAEIVYCDFDNSNICCPKPKEQVVIPVDTTSVLGRECLAYRNQLHQKCEPTPLIINGTQAKAQEYPHMALLGTKSENNPPKWYCGGSLISTKYIITAAHCFFIIGSLNYTRLGELDYDSDTDDAEPQDFYIKRYIPHPRYHWSQRYNDIALVEIDGEAIFNDYVAPICLPYSNGSEFSYFIATGWGSTKFGSSLSSSHLLKVNLERFDDSHCFEITEVSDDLEKGLHLQTQICAGSSKDNRDTCSGDSGGPLFVQHPHYPCMYLLVGVTSYGSACGTPGVPGVYSRVNLYVDWIEQIVWSKT